MEKEKTQPEKNIWKILFFILIGLLLVAAIVLITWNIARNDNKKESAETKITTDSSSTTPTSTKPKDTSTPTCAVLTDEDKASIENWETYTNETYKFSFRYPKEWARTIPGDAPDESASFVQLVDEETLAAVNLIYYGPEHVGRNPVSQDDLDSQKSTIVGCEKATNNIYKSTVNERTERNQRAIITTFSHDGKDYQLRLVYPEQGASVDADNVEAYYLVLKSFKFK